MFIIFSSYCSVIFLQSVTSCWIKHSSKRFPCCHHWPFLFPRVMAGCEDATQRAIKAWSATLSCHVVSAAPFVLINCWEKCVTSCQADCWCPSGHPSVPAARWCYCGSDRPQRRAGSCRMWDNTGKEEEGIPELCAEAWSAECLWDCSPVPSLPPLLPPRTDFVILSPFVCDGNENEDCILSCFFTGFPSSFQRVRSAFG